MSCEDVLRVLGVDGETGRPPTPVLSSVARRQAEALLRRPKPLRYGISSHELSEAGWGLVLPENADPAIRDALEPLLRLRRAQAGERYRELVYLPDESSLDFRQRLRMAHGRVDPRQMPWYLLMVASPREIPHAFEMDLDVPCAVGRLDFDHVDDLAAYAERVAALEQAPARRPERALVFAPTHPDEPPTDITAQYLAEPARALLASEGLTGEAVIGRGATRERLLQALAQPWDLWLFAGHAVQFRSGSKAQRPAQGALLCADWPGPVQHPEGSPLSQTVCAADLPDGALAGGLAVLFGCHTVGTGTVDLYHHASMDQAKASAPEPFTSAMAQALLGRRGGALGVLGHVGRAFEAAVFWRGASQTATFEDAMRAFCHGRRLGEAMDGFGQRFADVAASWTRFQMTGAGDVDPLDLWIAFHDAHSWCLMGDPAVRLPLGRS